MPGGLVRPGRGYPNLFSAAIHRGRLHSVYKIRAIGCGRFYHRNSAAAAYRGYLASTCRAMTSRCISEVPS